MAPHPVILIIEDDPDGRQALADVLEAAGYAVVAVGTGADGVDRFVRESFDTVVSDIRLPDIDGVQVLERLKQIDAAVPVILVTAYGTVASAVAALKAGAYDYILKPLDLNDIQAKVARAIETRRLRAEVSNLKQALSGSRPIIARSAPMLALLKQVRAVASTQATVLVVGESGTGKELIARALHGESPRATGPFVAVNCGAFSESLLESELFGHEKGSFTGATARHEGAFERAQHGTLFLDEIGIAPAPVQVRLLRVLEEREVIRVGGSQAIPVDVRIVSATNRDLGDLVAEKTFRPDLLYRLQVVTLRLPPLRERPEDIRPLAEHFLRLACAEHGRHIESVDDAFYQQVERHRWAGNVRELKNAVESAVIMSGTTRLTADLLPLGSPSPASAGAAPRSLAEMERQAILEALQRHDGNRALAADALGVSSRTIQRKIRDYDLPF